PPPIHIRKSFTMSSPIPRIIRLNSESVSAADSGFSLTNGTIRFNIVGNGPAEIVIPSDIFLNNKLPGTAFPAKISANPGGSLAVQTVSTNATAITIGFDVPSGANNIQIDDDSIVAPPPPPIPHDPLLSVPAIGEVLGI